MAPGVRAQNFEIKILIWDAAARRITGRPTGNAGPIVAIATLPERSRHVGRRSEGNDRHFNVSHTPEEFSSEILGTPGIDGSDIHLSRVPTCRFHNVLDGSHWRACPGHDQRVEERSSRSRGKVRKNVVRR